MKILRPVIVFIGLIAAWWALVLATGAPHFILPGPLLVARALAAHWPELLEHAGVTVTEILLGLALGTL
jgi:putative hydroxymethylpyrimidine transport system permease protein